LSGRGLCDELITRPEESYRLWCVVCVWSRNIKNRRSICIYDISNLRVKSLFDTFFVSTPVFASFKWSLSFKIRRQNVCAYHIFPTRATWLYTNDVHEFTSCLLRTESSVIKCRHFMLLGETIALHWAESYGTYTQCAELNIDIFETFF